MSISVIHPIVASMVDGVAKFVRQRTRANNHAKVVIYLEGMPEYLRRDIGLTPDADLAEAVERGLAPVTQCREPHRGLFLTPRAA